MITTAWYQVYDNTSCIRQLILILFAQYIVYVLPEYILFYGKMYYNMVQRSK